MRRSPAFDLLQRALACVAMISLAGCADVHLTQDADQVIVRTTGHDNFNEHQSAGPVAARIAPYALLAEQSYDPEVYRTKHLHLASRDCIADDAAGCEHIAELQNRAHAMLRDWRLVWACDGSKDCKVETGGGKPAVDGLGVQVWLQNRAVCTEAVVAFRGTVGGSEGDWVSNLHWLTRNLPVYDQYDQVRDHVGDFLAKLDGQPCYRPGPTLIVAVGHSLGGGLAQLASYADKNVRRVYAFDPSMVTGFYSSKLEGRDHNVVGHRTERVYEHGEILAYPRLLLRQFTPPTPCDPRIVTVRFDILHGNGFTQHGLTPFATALLREARGKAPERNPFVERACDAKIAGAG